MTQERIDSLLIDKFTSPLKVKDFYIVKISPNPAYITLKDTFFGVAQLTRIDKFIEDSGKVHYILFFKHNKHDYYLEVPRPKYGPNPYYKIDIVRPQEEIEARSFCYHNTRCRLNDPYNSESYYFPAGYTPGKH